jgi:hypothetical protein
MSFVLGCLSDSGTIETPSPAAKRFKVEVSCGASLLRRGRKPERSQAAITASVNPGRTSR